MGDWIIVIEGRGYHGESGSTALSEGEAASMMNDFIIKLKKAGHVVIRGQVVSNCRQMAHPTIVEPLYPIATDADKEPE